MIQRALCIFALACAMGCGGRTADRPIEPQRPPDNTTTTAPTPSMMGCAAGGRVASSNAQGVVCLSPLGSGGSVSTNGQMKWIPGPAHIVEAR